MEQPEDWTEPGAFLASPGVHRIPLPLPNDALRAVNVYAVASEAELVLIDGGWALARSRAQLGHALKDIGWKLSDVSKILVTHSHRDHYTQAVSLRREFGMRIALGSGEQDNLAAVVREGTNSIAAQRANLRRHGAAELAEDPRVQKLDQPVEEDVWALPDEWIDHGSRVQLGKRSLVATATPGHTRGHVVYSDESAQLLFAGDHVLPHITPSLGFEPVPPPSPLGDFLHSLAAVRTMPDRVLLPAHGPVATSTHQRVDELLAHHDQRLHACEEAVQDGASTAYAVAAQLTWTRRSWRLNELDPFNRVLAVGETISHLVVLEAQGRLRSVSRDGVVRWAPSDPSAALS